MYLNVQPQFDDVMIIVTLVSVLPQSVVALPMVHFLKEELEEGYSS